MKSLFTILTSLLAGAVAGASIVWWLSLGATASSTSDKDSNQPLYWVAPMDPNYRRDQPGKSPMGMDLVPVYEEKSQDMEPGDIKIAPNVVNNLGIRTAVARRGHIESTVKTVGFIQYDEDRLVHIHPRVEGWIETLNVKAVGDPVAKGAPLYGLYSPTLVNAQEEFLLAQKRKSPALIEAALARLEALQVPSTEIEKLKKSGVVNQTITVISPQSGVLDDLAVREGMFVKPGMEIMSIGQLEHLWLIGEVFERQLAEVRQGDSVTVTLDYLPGREWIGTVDYIYPSLNKQTRSARVRILIDNSDLSLRPGMFAEILISTQPGRETLLIPREALIRTGSQARVVLAKGKGTFKSIAVKTGRVSQHQVEILEGLREGDEIVTSAQFLLDSESSIDSDFQRMSIRHNSKNQATVDGTINKVNSAQRVLNISRGPIKKWNRPAVTMDFAVAQNLDMSVLSVGDKVEFTFIIDEGDFIVTDLTVNKPAMIMDLKEHQHD